MLKIGILRETKHPAERRVPLTPSQAAYIQKTFPSLKILIQPGKNRIFTDVEYSKAGIEVRENLSNCDWLIGIKEVNIEDFIEGKNYLFFSHVIKKQAHNFEMFSEIVKKAITLVDYELFTDDKGFRLVAFGRWAGIVGAYNGLRAWGIRHNRYFLKPAYLCHSRQELFENVHLLRKPSLKILITGEGRVAGGVMELLSSFGATKIDISDFLSREFPVPVYCQIGPQHYTKHISGQEFDFRHFALVAREYHSTFSPFTRAADMLITAHYWDPASPKMIKMEDMQLPGFRVQIIADISCDIDGPIASTLRASTIEDPFYDFDPFKGKEMAPFSGEKNITIMAVDNLPAELPRDASESFGQTLIEYVFPEIAHESNSRLIEKATIVKKGKIMPRFSYLEDWTGKSELK
jgi:saccharopine dehydrogenase (NAD+, L-lysine-forming)